MNSTVELMLADAKAQVYYWPLRYLAWGIWGLIFAGTGMLVVRFFWQSRRMRAEDLEKENRRLRRELADVERQHKGRM